MANITWYWETCRGTEVEWTGKTTFRKVDLLAVSAAFKAIFCQSCILHLPTVSMNSQPTSWEHTVDVTSSHNLPHVNSPSVWIQYLSHVNSPSAKHQRTINVTSTHPLFHVNLPWSWINHLPHIDSPSVSHHRYPRQFIGYFTLTHQRCQVRQLTAAFLVKLDVDLEDWVVSLERLKIDQSTWVAPSERACVMLQRKRDFLLLASCWGYCGGGGGDVGSGSGGGCCWYWFSCCFCCCCSYSCCCGRCCVCECVLIYVFRLFFSALM